MKKFFVLASFSAMLMSCSKDDDNQSKPFFNFKVGETWAYQYYNNNLGTLTADSNVDTVKVVDTEALEGKTYFKFETLTYKNGNIINTDIQYRRVDEYGHLVDEQDFVIHPGTDINYTIVIPYQSGYGELSYELYPEENIDVGGVNYNTYNYQGYYTPQTAGVEGVGSSYYYAEGIGLVKDSYRYLSSTDVYIERHLTYHN